MTSFHSLLHLNNFKYQKFALFLFLTIDLSTWYKQSKTFNHLLYAHQEYAFTIQVKSYQLKIKTSLLKVLPYELYQEFEFDFIGEICHKMNEFRDEFIFQELHSKVEKIAYELGNDVGNIHIKLPKGYHI